MEDERIPRLYETDGVPFERKVIHMRYEIRPIGYYWLIVELDKKENLVFGYVNLNDDLNSEWGYISIAELLNNGAELDRGWKACSYQDAKRRI